MTKHPSTPCALTIAGSDSGGGAGIQADLHTFAAFEVHGLTAITCLTAQSPTVVAQIEPVKPSVVQAQIEAVQTTFRPRAAKIGMLYSAKIVAAVIKSLAGRKGLSLVIDPILVSSSGRPLLQRTARRLFRDGLLPLATLITPNIPEAEELTGRSIQEPENMRSAARDLFDQWGRPVLIKGGHGGRGQSALDIFFDGRDEYLFTSPRIPGAGVHGTGCTLSAAITAGLARGDTLLEAIQTAKEFTARSIAEYRRVHRHRVLGWGASRKR